MTPLEYTWTINSIKERHIHLDLTFEQAEKIYQFEQEKNLHSGEFYFSVWEEYDYVYDNYQKILDEEQLKEFKIWHGTNIKRHEEFLIESDKDQTKYIDYQNGLLEFYNQVYIPDFYKEVYIHQLISLEGKNESKVALVKHEYRSFLESQKVGFISEHYRHNKLFRPNELKATLLKHELNYIVPRYSYFKIKMDEPTRVAAHYLIDALHYIPQRYEDFFKREDEKLRLVADELRTKHLEEVTGWHTTIAQTEKQGKEDQIMRVVLLDEVRILPLLNAP